MKRRKKRRYLAPLGLLAVALVAAGVWYYREGGLNLGSNAQATTTTLQTTRARQGDMRISITGTGTLYAGSEVDLGFEESGQVTEVLVQMGDQVEVGDVLARLDRRAAESRVAQAKVSLRLAELELSELEEGASTDEIATARASLASAQEALADLQAGASEEELASARASLASAEENYRDLAAGPSTDKVLSAEASLEKARLALQQAQVDYAEAAGDPSKSAAALATYQSAQMEYELAQVNYETSMAGASAAELQAAAAQVTQARANLETLQTGASAAQLASAEAQVESAQTKLDELLAGPTDLERETAALAVDNARYDLDEAERQLEATDLVAPIAGKVTVVDVVVGETVAANAVVVGVADLSNVQVRFYVDETDMANLAVGLPVEVTFDAYGDRVFTGKVTTVEPGLSTVSMVPVVTAWASLDVPEGDAVGFVENMNAIVEVVVAERAGVVLVPMEAVREIADGQYAVFVVDADGELEMRTVQIGLTDDIYYEIVGGLTAGEQVSTGTSMVTGG